MKRNEHLKHKPSLLTRRKRKRLAAKGSPNKKQVGKWTVRCDVHGVADSGTKEKLVSVGAPKSKAVGRSGCPMCQGRL